MDRGRTRAATSRSKRFIALAEQISGRELDGFFNTWLYTKSKPPGITP